MTYAALAKRVFLAAILAVFSLACGNVDEGARELFSSENTCPIGQVVSGRRVDVPASSFLMKTKPSTEIAANPARLAMWNQEQADKKKSEDSYAWTVVEVHGCGQQKLMKCTRNNRGGSSAFSCFSYDFPEGIKPSW